MKNRKSCNVDLGHYSQKKFDGGCVNSVSVLVHFQRKDQRSKWTNVATFSIFHYLPTQTILFKL